jgi:translation elongation factor EF-Ts
MRFIEETRQVIQDFLPPELREMRGQLAGMEKQLKSMNKRLDSQDKRQELHEEAIRARFDNIVQRLELIQQSFAFDKRISDLEADKRRSA